MKTIYLTLGLSLISLTQGFAFDQSHQALTKIIKGKATQSGVKYASLKSQHPELKSYLQDLSKVKESEFKKWSSDERLSFLINLYNATTLNLVLDHYPIKSLKDEVGGEKGPWKSNTVNVFGSITSLDKLENELIRKSFNEPRIHFALNCASAGCPPLLDEAYKAKELNKQLEKQTKKFMANKSVNKLRGKTLTLSPLFDWFKVILRKSQVQ